MHISSLNSTPQIWKDPVNNGEKQQRKIRQAEDSYSRNAADAQVIDAEYVERYTTGKNSLQHERQTLDLALEPQTGDKALAQKTYPGSNSPGNRYQLMALDTPPPGTYLNVFA